MPSPSKLVILRSPCPPQRGWCWMLGCIVLLGLGGAGPAVAQLPPTVAWCEDPPWTPRAYGCPHVAQPPTIDGRLDDDAWKHAQWSAAFGDIQGSKQPAPRFATRIKMAWDDRAWYIAAELSDPHVWASIIEHDAVIFHDNDFEVFLDPDGDNHQYGELELNALNTTWDLFLDRPYKDGGNADNAWEIEGLRTAVAVDGSLNDPSDIDRGWTVEIAIPFASLRRLGVVAAPQAGAVWRVDFSRVQWRHEIVDGQYQRVPQTPEDNWVWSPQGVINMHRPETWGYLVFQADGATPDPHPERFAEAKRWLHHVYYLQKQRRANEQPWAERLADLATLSPPPKNWDSGLEQTAAGFRAWIQQGRTRWTIDQAALLRRDP